MLLPATVNLVFVIFCLASVQPNTRLLRSPSNKKEGTSPLNKQLKSAPLSQSLGNGNLDTKDFITLQGFPDVIYPTSIYESSQPFYFKTGGYDDVLGPFSDDVKSTYKLLLSNNKKPVTKASAITSEVKKDKTNVALSNPETEENPIVIKEDSDCLECSGVIENNESNDTRTNTLPKEPIFIDIIYNEGSPLESPTLELIPPYVPVRLKVNIEICKDDCTLQENSNLTECIEKEDFENYNETNKTNVKKELIHLNNLETPGNDVNLINEDKITVLDEINETDLISALSILLFDSLNNKPIELPITDIIHSEDNLNSSRESTLNIFNDTNIIENHEDFVKPQNITEAEHELYRSEESNILEESQGIQIREIPINYDKTLNDLHKNTTDHTLELKNENDHTKSENNTNVER